MPLIEFYIFLFSYFSYNHLLMLQVQNLIDILKKINKQNKQQLHFLSQKQQINKIPSQTQLLTHHLSMLSSQQPSYNQPLILLKKYHQYLTTKPHWHIQILVHQRMVYLISTALQNNQPLPQGIQLLSQLSAFINKVSIRVMSTSLQQMQFQQKLNLISKCIDMLFYKSVRINTRPVQKLLQLRALAFNNLSCLYKQNHQYEDALKSLQVSLQIQETLLTKNYQDTCKSIASTYINKCVILSSLSLHQEAIETIKTSLEKIQKYQEKFGKEIQVKEQTEIKSMTMLAYFNIAVEYQYLGQVEVGVKFYQLAYKLAKEVGNSSVKSQALAALRKLKAKK